MSLHGGGVPPVCTMKRKFVRYRGAGYYTILNRLAQQQCALFSTREHTSLAGDARVRDCCSLRLEASVAMSVAWSSTTRSMPCSRRSAATLTRSPTDRPIRASLVPPGHRCRSGRPGGHPTAVSWPACAMPASVNILLQPCAQSQAACASEFWPVMATLIPRLTGQPGKSVDYWPQMRGRAAPFGPPPVGASQFGSDASRLDPIGRYLRSLRLQAGGQYRPDSLAHQNLTAMITATQTMRPIAARTINYSAPTRFGAWGSALDGS